MSMKVEVKVKDKDVLDYFDSLPQNYESIVDEEIGIFMNKLKIASTNYHPWITRSGILERSHKYVRLAPMNWQFTVNTKVEGADYNYAPLLEYNLLNYSRSYTWFNPHYQRLYPELISSIKNRFAELTLGGKIKKFFKGLGKRFGIGP